MRADKYESPLKIRFHIQVATYIHTTAVGDWSIEDGIGDTGLGDCQWIVVIRREAHVYFFKLSHSVLEIYMANHESLHCDYGVQYCNAFVLRHCNNWREMFTVVWWGQVPFYHCFVTSNCIYRLVIQPDHF